MDKKENEEKPKLTKEQKEKMKKYAIFALMCAICAGALWFIFAPSSDKKAKLKAQSGFNTDIPMPKDAGLTDDKREAYEKEKVKETQDARMRSLSDFSELLGGDASKTKKDENLSLNVKLPFGKKPFSFVLLVTPLGIFNFGAKGISPFTKTGNSPLQSTGKINVSRPITDLSFSS